MRPAIMFCVVLSWLDFSLAGASADDAPQNKIPEPMAKFAELPVRFNGRVATYDVVAKNYLRRFSGGETAYDANGKPLPAVRWLLDVMTARKDRHRWRIFEIREPKLLEALDLSDRPKGSTQFLFSFEELVAKIDVIERNHQKLFDKPLSTYQPEDHAVTFLYDDLVRYSNLETSFRPPDNFNRDNARRVLNQVNGLIRSPMPSFIPHSDSASWEIYFTAALKERVAPPEQRNPLFQSFDRILHADIAKDDKAFQDAVDAYHKAVSQTKAVRSPFRFDPPADWIEKGTDPSASAFYYGDADAFGRQVVELSIGDHDEARFIINYFREPDLSLVNLVNSWRITLGLVPLAEGDLKATLNSVKVAGRTGVQIDHDTPEYVPLPFRKRYLTSIVQDQGHTFVFSWYGDPKLLETHRVAHRKLMDSIEMDSVKELSEWFPLDVRTPNFPARHLLAAVVPDGRQAWVFVISGIEKETEDQREKFMAFVQSLRFTKTANKETPLQWTLPEDWRKTGDFGEATLMLGADSSALPLTITPLGEAKKDTVTTLARYWAQKLRAGDMSDEQISKCIRPIEIAGRDAHLVEIRTPEPKKPDAKIDFTYKAPAHWKPLEAKTFHQAAFEIAKGEHQAKLTVSTLPARDNLALNINRWRAQIELPAQEKTAALKETKAVTIDQQQGTLVDLHNPKTKQRILAAIVKRGDQDWYFKLMGNAEVVEGERENFKAFLKSVEFSAKK